MDRPLVAFDLDDVIAASTDFWRTETNRLTGIALTGEHWNVPGEYDSYYETVWRTHGVAHLISIADIDARMAADQTGISLHEGVSDALNALHGRYRFAVVTARDSAQEAATRRWLEANLPGIFDIVVFADGLEGLARRNKGDICRHIGAAWLVDDHIRHCLDAMAAGIRPVLFGDYGWQAPVPDGIVRCRDWHQIREYFDGLEA